MPDDEHETDGSFNPDEEKPLDEFGYEKLMRESDARTDRYMELREKYKDHPDGEKLAAKEMGWDSLVEGLEARERGEKREFPPVELPPLEPNPATEGVDWVRCEDDDIHHPLTKRAMESGIAIWQFCDDLGLMEENGDMDLADMLTEFQIAGAKIAGALDGLAYDDDDTREPGLIIASLKRALNYMNSSMAAAEKVAAKQLLDAERLKDFRDELFAIRQEILHFMKHFRDAA